MTWSLGLLGFAAFIVLISIGVFLIVKGYRTEIRAKKAEEELKTYEAEKRRHHAYNIERAIAGKPMKRYPLYKEWKANQKEIS